MHICVNISKLKHKTVKSIASDRFASMGKQANRHTDRQKDGWTG